MKTSDTATSRKFARIFPISIWQFARQRRWNAAAPAPFALTRRQQRRKCVLLLCAFALFAIFALKSRAAAIGKIRLLRCRRIRRIQKAAPVATRHGICDDTRMLASDHARQANPKSKILYPKSPMSAFPEITKIPYEGPQSKNPLAFR